MTSKATTTKAKSTAKDRTAKAAALAAATRRLPQTGRALTRAVAAKAAPKSHAKTAVAAKSAAKSATKRAAAAKAAKAAAEKVSSKAKTPEIKTVKPIAASKTAAAKPVKAVAPAIKPVEQSKPAAAMAPAAPRPVEKATAPAPSAPPALAESAPVGAARPAVPAKAKPTAALKTGFKLSEFIVYPAHGVGQIVGVETQEVAGFSLELFVVSFIKDKMILKVPTSKVVNVGMRKLADAAIVDKALQTLSGRARIKRTMWSRRAQEYEAKINSGDLVTIAEVVRDLYRSDTQPEQSYSERQLYEAALDRMAREIAAVRKLIDSESLKLIESFLLKGPRRGPKADGDVGDDGGEEADVDRAA
ncbi:CarD family transcriptional regulator [Methylocystis sp.]|uniref:CarD family transcriptional regulator n=1 Tax=Methylocystis sp. TaxID=1911079 RepID=UPI0025E2D019|nr:CarD family transcriptional regulator [Methylocystis sp.]